MSLQLIYPGKLTTTGRIFICFNEVCTVFQSFEDFIEVNIIIIINIIITIIIIIIKLDTL